MTTPKPIALVVDDDPDILDTTARFLTRRGIEVLTSPTAIGVRALILRHAPDVLVLDVRMPALDGPQLAGLVRARSPSDLLPIVFYTSLDEDAVSEIATRVPGARYVLKSAGPRSLHEAITSALAGP